MESGHGVTIRRSDFHRILTDEVTRRNVPVHYGKRLCAMEQTGDIVVAHFEDGHVETGDMLLAADGVHSRARALILRENASPRYTGFLGIGGFAEAGSASPADPGDAHHLNFTVGQRFQFGYTMISGAPESWGWWTHLPEGDELTRAELQAISDDSIHDPRSRGVRRAGTPPIQALVSNTKQTAWTAIYDVPSLPAWHVGRVMLLGDAAHAMSPAGGQGASLALEDAMLVGGTTRGPVSSPWRGHSRPWNPQLRARAERMVKQAAENDLRQVKRTRRIRPMDPQSGVSAVRTTHRSRTPASIHRVAGNVRTCGVRC